MIKAQVVSTSYTRLDNATQYAANDALSDSTSAPAALEFAGVKSNTGRVVGLRVIDGANQATLPQMEVYIFDGSAAPTATNDNAEFGLTDANALNLVCIFALSSFYDLDVTSGTNGNAAAMGAPAGLTEVPFECGKDSTLYGLVKILNAYTPIAKEVFIFELLLDLD